LLKKSKQSLRCPRNGKQVKGLQTPLCNAWEGANLESSFNDFQLVSPETGLK